MNKIKTIDAALGIKTPEEKEMTTIKERKDVVVPKEDEAFIQLKKEQDKKDYFTSRENLAEVLDTMKDLIISASTEIKAEPSARFFESFSLLVKTFYDINKDAYGNPLKTPEETEASDKPTPLNNFIFNGTSESLLDQLKRGR